MDEVLDITQADAFMDELHAYRKRVLRRQRETQKERAGAPPQLRTWLADASRPARRNVQNAQLAARAVRQYGALVAMKAGIPVGSQILQQLHLYYSHRMPADNYYFLRMYDKHVRRKARFFLDEWSGSKIMYHLAATAPAEEFEPLLSKTAFWKHCCKHGFPTVPNLAVFNNGSLQRDYDGISGALPAQDLFSKPVSAYSGKGVRKWTHHDEGYKDETGRVYTPRAVIGALEEQSNQEMVLLQPCVYDHPRLQALTGNPGPSILKIVTIRMPGAAPEFFATVFTTSLEDVPAPMFKNGTALAARVDVGSGRMSRLVCKRAAYLLEDRERHPRTDKAMAGAVLPHWDEAKAMAMQAHVTLPGIACLKCDIVLTGEGPRLLEFSKGCSPELTQITYQRLLGLTRLPAYLSAHIQVQKD